MITARPAETSVSAPPRKRKKRPSRAGRIKPPREKYLCQKWRAKVRGVPWEITFEEWWAIWEASGKYHLRGIKQDSYVMARFGDKGPYHKDNVRICTVAENNAEHQVVRAEQKKLRPAKKKKNKANIGEGKGWSKRRNRYLAIFRGKKIARFDTPEEARAAYLEAFRKYMEGKQ